MAEKGKSRGNSKYLVIQNGKADIIENPYEIVVSLPDGMSIDDKKLIVTNLNGLSYGNYFSVAGMMIVRVLKDVGVTAQLPEEKKK